MGHLVIHTNIKVLINYGHVLLQIVYTIVNTKDIDRPITSYIDICQS